MRKDCSQPPQGVNAPVTILFCAIIVPCCFLNSISFSLSQNSAPFNFHSSLRIVNLRSLEEISRLVSKALYVLSNICEIKVHCPIAEGKVCQVKLTERWWVLLLCCLNSLLAVVFLILFPLLCTVQGPGTAHSPSAGLVRGRVLCWSWLG